MHAGTLISQTRSLIARTLGELDSLNVAHALGDPAVIDAGLPSLRTVSAELLDHAERLPRLAFVSRGTALDDAREATDLIARLTPGSASLADDAATAAWHLRELGASLF